jgi:hypothetical protein
VAFQLVNIIRDSAAGFFTTQLVRQVDVDWALHVDEMRHARLHFNG